MSELVERLAQGNHPVELTLRPVKTLTALKESLERGFVHVTFTETRGGTQLGFSVDLTRSDLANADLNAGTGALRLAGALTLDFIDVCCVADITLPEMTGTGHLEILAA